jgi:hypothetical protein
MQNSWSVLASGESFYLRNKWINGERRAAWNRRSGFMRLIGAAAVVNRSAEASFEGSEKWCRKEQSTAGSRTSGRYAGQLLAPSRSLSTGHSILTPCQDLVKPRA